MGSGKDEAFRALLGASKALNLRFHPISFAAPIKTMLRAYLAMRGMAPATTHRLVNGSFKDKARPLAELEGKSTRYAMQTLGTEWGRNLIGEDIWINTGRSRIEKIRSNRGVAVITDLRFPNEGDLVEELGGVTVSIERPGLVRPEDTHVSEQPLLCQYTLINEGTLAQYHEKVVLFYSTL